MWYLGSADWMRRTLKTGGGRDPIRDVKCINRMREIMEVGFSDARNAHLILPDGNSEPVSTIHSPIVKEAVNKGTFGTLVTVLGGSWKTATSLSNRSGHSVELNLHERQSVKPTPANRGINTQNVQLGSCSPNPGLINVSWPMRPDKMLEP